MADGYKEQAEIRKRKKSTKRVLTEQKELSTLSTGTLLADVDVFDALRDPAKLKVLHTELAKVKEEQLAFEAEQKKETAPLELVFIVDCSGSITGNDKHPHAVEKIRAGFTEFFEYVDEDANITFCTFSAGRDLQFLRQKPEVCKSFKYEGGTSTRFFDVAVPTLREVAAARKAEGAEGPWLAIFITDQDIYTTTEISKLKSSDLKDTTDELRGTGLQTMLISATGIDGQLIMEAIKFGVPGTRILKSESRDFTDNLMTVLDAIEQVRCGRREIEIEQSLALTMKM